jgi:hypothetical protein
MRMIQEAERAAWDREAQRWDNGPAHPALALDVPERAPADARHRPGPPFSPETPDRVPKRRRRHLMWAMSLGLGAVGAALGGAVAGYLAYQNGFSPRETAILAAMGSAGGATMLAMVPALVRALSWVLAAAAVGTVGAGVLWLISRADPELVLSLLPR